MNNEVILCDWCFTDHNSFKCGGIPRFTSYNTEKEILAIPKTESTNTDKDYNPKIQAVNVKSLINIGYVLISISLITILIHLIEYI